MFRLKLLKLIIFLLFSFFYLEVFSYSSQKISLKPKSSLKISHFEGRILFKENNTLPYLIIKYENIGKFDFIKKQKEDSNSYDNRYYDRSGNGGYSYDDKDFWTAKLINLKDQNEIILKFDNPSNKKDNVSKHAKNNLPIVIIEGKSIAVNLFGNIGEVVFNKWSNDINLTLFKGKINLNDTKGDNFIFNHSGSVQVNNHTGKLELQTYESNLKIVNLTGGLLEIFNFLGETLLHDVNGSIVFNGFKGNTQIIDGKGDVYFDNISGVFKVSGFKGSIDGLNNDGKLNLNFEPETRLKIKTNSGLVKINAPRTSGAYVNLLNKEGSIIHPHYLKLHRLSRMKLVKGRLRGKKTGSIYVESEEGSVVLR